MAEKSEVSEEGSEGKGRYIFLVAFSHGEFLK